MAPMFRDRRSASSRRWTVWGALVASMLASAVAGAKVVNWTKVRRPYSGVVIRQGRTTSNTTNVTAAFISLCTSYVHVAATPPAKSRRTAGNWAWSIGAQVAVNGDFFKYTTPPDVYGDAVGGGKHWPLSQIGTDDSGQWYYRRYGWIAFGNGWANFTHSKYVKKHAKKYGLSEGWYPKTVTTKLPKGTKALVSGFPELVVEGKQVTCSSPTASSCFPDRSDMRQRHPRTAMGLSRDRHTFILAVVDGRTTTSKGMYGTELAALMKDLGAHVAFNIDGGGSSQMYLRGVGYLVNATHSSSARAVANHWAVFAGKATGKSSKPGSCYNNPPKGYLDGASCTRIHGWAQDIDKPSTALSVRIYFDSKPTDSKPTLRTVKADRHRSDLCKAIGSCKHAFSLATPSSLKNGKAHTIRAYAVDPVSRKLTQLNKSPRKLTCKPTVRSGDGGGGGSDGGAASGDASTANDGATYDTIAAAGDATGAAGEGGAATSGGVDATDDLSGGCDCALGSDDPEASLVLLLVFLLVLRLRRRSEVLHSE